LRCIPPNLIVLALLTGTAATIAGCAPTQSFEPDGPFQQWLTTFPAALKAFRDAEGRWPASGAELAAFAASHDIGIDRPFLHRVRCDPAPDGTLVTVWHDGDEYFGSRWRWVDDAPHPEAIAANELRRESHRRGRTVSN
jgi:hypothetical protein